jgi:predicted TPR repeat methyltransferase
MGGGVDTKTYRLTVLQSQCDFDFGLIPNSNKQKSYKIMKMQMFATLDKAIRDTGNIRGLNLVAVNHTTVQVNRLLL